MPSKKRPTTSSSKNISIGGDVVNGVVIAGDNNIVNYFKGEYVSLKEHYVPPDSVFQRVRTEDFVGRDWLTAQLDAFLNDPQRKSGAFLLIGDAGVGKTSFMAHLVKERGYLHLFAEQVPGQAMLQRAIQSLGSQLVTRYQIDPYKDRDTLIQGTVFPDFLERLLRMAASKLTGSEKIVIVCDALDEAGTFPDGNVFGLPNVLPDGVYLILSQRPVNVKLPNLEPLTVRLEAQGADNLQDMEKYLGAVAQRASVADQLRAKNYSDAFFIQTLKEKSLGVWMYLHYVIKEIEQGSRAPLELEALPTGLVGYYADFWGDWRMGRKGRGKGEQAWNALYAPLLTTLAAAQEAITIGTLIQWADVDADEDEVARLVAEDWRAFIEEKEVGAETRYKPYHLSFADFIAGKADYEKLPPAQKNLMRDLAKRTVKAHQRIVKVFEAECNGQWDRLVEREYPRLHLSAHLNGAGEYEKLRILLTEGDEKIKWAEAREQKEETYAGYLNDLSYVWAYAEREQNYALAIRCMLTENSIHSLASNIFPELLSELAKAGLWSYVRCISTIRENSNSYAQAESLKLIIPDILPMLQPEALRAACEIKDENYRARALAALAPHLNEELKSQILVTTREIKSEHHRSLVLADIAPFLNEELKSQTLAAAREIKDESDRAHTLVALAPHLSEELKSQLLPEVLAAARQIKDESDCAHTLVALAPHLSEELKSQVLSEALGVALEIKSEHRRSLVLADIAPLLNEELNSQALTVAREIKDESDRAYTLVALAPHLSEELKSHVLPEALVLVRKIKAVYSNASALLATLALHLNEERKTQVLQEALTIAVALGANALVALTPYLNSATLKAQVLAAACEINDEHYRDFALGAIVRYLNDDEIKPQALAAVREIKNEFTRANALVNLAPHLNEELKFQVLREVLVAARKIKDKSHRANALGTLAPHLSEELKTQTLQEALVAAREIEDETFRSRVLMALASHLNNGMLKSIALAEVRAIKNENDRISALSALIPNLNDELLKSLALTMTYEIKDESARVSVLAALAPHLNDNALKTQALAAARAVKDEYDRVNALGALAPHQNEEIKSQLLQEALEVASKIESEDTRASALVNLATRLNNDTFKARALAVMREIKHEVNRARALEALVPYLNNDTLKTQALAVAREINDEFTRAKALVNLAPHLNENLKFLALQEAFAAAHKIKEQSSHASALIYLAPHLNKEGKSLVIQEALAAIRGIKYEQWRASALASLAQHLNNENKSLVLQEAVVTVREIKDEYIRAYTLANLASQLNDEALKSQALEVAREIKGGSHRASALGVLALYMDESSKPQIFQESFSAIHEIEDDSNRYYALETLVQHLNDEFKPQALKEILYLSNIHLPLLSSNDLLSTAFSTWKDIEYKGLRNELLLFIQFASQEERNYGLEVIIAITPALVHFSGEENVAELYRAIQDTARWWP